MQSDSEYLTKRLQPVMEMIYKKGKVTAAELEAELPGSPSNSTVRTHLRNLETRGLVSHAEEDGKYVYYPTQQGSAAAKNTMKRLLHTFFGGAIDKAFATLLEARDTKLTDEEIQKMTQMIEAAKEEGR